MKMKKSIIILMGVLMMFGLFGCGKQKNQSETEVNNFCEIKVVNKVKEADIWIIPETEENKKTTVWGKATVSKADAKLDEEVVAKIQADVNTYMIRLIDVDEMFYSADGVVIEKQQKVVIRNGKGDMTAFVEVYNSDGSLAAEYEMFEARL